MAFPAQTLEQGRVFSCNHFHPVDAHLMKAHTRLSKGAHVLVNESAVRRRGSLGNDLVDGNSSRAKGNCSGAAQARSVTCLIKAALLRFLGENTE
jgi:hypothetical protein